MSYYVIEDLGIEPCILLVDGDDLAENVVSVAHFYRVSASAQTQMHQLINLQSIMIIAEIIVNACNQQRFQVASKGRQSWREVYLN